MILDRLQIVGEKSSLPDVKLYACAVCARSVKLQELSFEDNYYPVYQTEMSRTMVSELSKVRIIQRPTLLLCLTSFLDVN